MVLKTLLFQQYYYEIKGNIKPYCYYFIHLQLDDD